MRSRRGEADLIVVPCAHFPRCSEAGGGESAGVEYPRAVGVDHGQLVTEGCAPGGGVEEEGRVLR